MPLLKPLVPVRAALTIALTIGQMCGHARAQQAPATATMPSPYSDAMAGQVEERIALLHRQLGITAAQSKVWEAFTAVMRANAHQMAMLEDAQARSAAGRTAVEDLAAYAAAAQAHAAAVQRLVAPFAALYATMSPAQRLAADSVLQRAAARRLHGLGAHG